MVLRSQFIQKFPDQIRIAFNRKCGITGLTLFTQPHINNIDISGGKCRQQDQQYTRLVVVLGKNNLVAARQFSFYTIPFVEIDPFPVKIWQFRIVLIGNI